MSLKAFSAASRLGLRFNFEAHKNQRHSLISAGLFARLGG